MLIESYMAHLKIKHLIHDSETETHREIYFVCTDMHALTSLKNPWQRLAHHLLVHHFHHVSF